MENVPEKVDCTNDELMVQEGLRVPPLQISPKIKTVKLKRNKELMKECNKTYGNVRLLYFALPTKGMKVKFHCSKGKGNNENKDFKSTRTFVATSLTEFFQKVAAKNINIKKIINVKSVLQ